MPGTHDAAPGTFSLSVYQSDLWAIRSKPEKDPRGKVLDSPSPLSPPNEAPLLARLPI